MSNNTKQKKSIEKLNDNKEVDTQVSESEQHKLRKEKLQSLREAGYPFPNDVKVDISCKDFRDKAEKISSTDSNEDAPKEIHHLAGRLVAIRSMGKAAFCQIQDHSGRLQFYIRKDEVSEEEFKTFKQLDIGDIVAVTGYGFVTKTGEPSLHATSIRMLVKCLHPLPEKWHGLSDVEARYRKRYLDLIVNPNSREIFKKRSKIVSYIRNFLEGRGYLEVETPVMNTVASGAAAKPFTTHHNSLNLDLHMRIALELPLKKLVVGGLERVFELSRVFRNEGISTQHNPEFTMIEFYQAYATYEDLIELTQELITGLCNEISGSTKLTYGETEINFQAPWQRLTMIDAVHKYASVDKSNDLKTMDGVKQAAKDLGHQDLLELDDAGRILYEIYDREVEDKIIDPTFITQFPKVVSPLARPNDNDPNFVDRFELIVNGMEVANAFSELNDAIDQRQRMEEQAGAKSAGDEEAMDLDEDFVTALEYGMPPTAGQGIGIDRLVMLLTNSTSIREVILFPTLKPR